MTLSTIVSRSALVWVAIVALAAPARADDESIVGFTTQGTGELTGSVTDHDGKPVAGIEVHIVSASGPQQHVTTDKDGRYRASLNGGAYAMVFIHGRARIGGQIVIPTRNPGGEVVEIHESIPPEVTPQPRGNPAVIPPYSETAKENGAWTRAWLLLDVDDKGTVTRVKLMRKPGHGLDQSAIRGAFKLQFDPARDRANRPINAMMLWTFEWPSYWWMSEQRHLFDRLPLGIRKIPCRGSGGTRPYYRDCTRVDLVKGMAEPWIDRPKS